MAKQRKVEEIKNIGSEFLDEEVRNLNQVSEDWVEPEEAFNAEPTIAQEGSLIPEGPTAHNWQPINTAQHNGLPVKLTNDPGKEGVIAFWRKSRAFANATHRWEETGFWTDSITGKNIDFVPLWWKDRHAV